MTRGPGWLILAAAIAYIFGVLWFWNWLPQPCHRFPEWNQQERAKIKKVMKRHGKFTLIRTDKGLYLKKANGIIWIARR